MMKCSCGEFILWEMGDRDYYNKKINEFFKQH